MTFFIAVDVGGTFTDLVGIDEETGLLVCSKVHTTPDRPGVGVMRSIEAAQIEPNRISDIVHGSTVAVNTVIEGKGAKTILLTTKGFKDVYIIGRGNRPDVFNIFFKKPRPLIRRSQILEIDERVLSNGKVLKKVNDKELENVCRHVMSERVESVAICFLHSHINPVNEVYTYEWLKKNVPECYVTYSAGLVRKYGEYERTVTTVVNAYIGPVVADYIKDLEFMLQKSGFHGYLFIMQSNGGMTTTNAAVEKPVALMESGPVGGIIAAAEVGRKLGLSNIITLDIGGTTAKTSVIFNGVPQVVDHYTVGDQHVMYPVVDIVEVGAGGGSIAWIDSVGALKVGPRSAGAVPGPVCYDMGGTQPTVTDANLILGRLGEQEFLGGTMRLNREKAYQAVKQTLSSKLNQAVEETALSIVDIAVHITALAVRRVTIERGHDPRDFVLMVFGGAGPLHATAVARELYIKKILIPLYPAHFSALGMILSDHRIDMVRTFFCNLKDLDVKALAEFIEQMKMENINALSQQNMKLSGVRHEVFLQIRYAGQEFTTPVPIHDEDLTKLTPQKIFKKFNIIYEKSYGYSFPYESAELVEVHLATIGQRMKPKIDYEVKHVNTEPVEHRRVGVGKRFIEDCPVYQREFLPAGFKIKGPAIIREYASTTFLMEDDVCEVLETGELLIHVGEGDDR